MRKDEGARAQFQRAAHDLARVDGRVVDRADALHLVGDQGVALVQEENAKFFAVGIGHGGAAIVGHRREGREHGALFQRAARKAAGGRLDDLQLGDRGFA